MRVKTMLEIAKETESRVGYGRIKPGELELTVAWVSGQVSTKQLAAAYKAFGIGYQGGMAPARAATTLKNAVSSGMIEIVVK